MKLRELSGRLVWELEGGLEAWHWIVEGEELVEREEANVWILEGLAGLGKLGRTNQNTSCHWGARECPTASMGNYLIDIWALGRTSIAYNFPLPDIPQPYTK